MLRIPDSVMPHVRRFGFSGLVAVGIVVVMLFGINPVTILTGQVATPNPYSILESLEAVEARGEPREVVIEAVNRETNGFWERAFRQAAIHYPPVTLTSVADRSGIGCGLGGSAIGTVYCPADHTIYVDMANYAALAERHPGMADKVQAYLIGRAYGHHVQEALGLFAQLAETRANGTPEEIVMLEQRLSAQAECHAGAWTKFAGLEVLPDDPAFLAALADASRPQEAAAMPSRSEAIVPALLTPAPPDFAREWFDAGYAIPAGGTCRLEKIGTPG